MYLQFCRNFHDDLDFQEHCQSKFLQSRQIKIQRHFRIYLPKPLKSPANQTAPENVNTAVSVLLYCENILAMFGS